MMLSQRFKQWFRRLFSRRKTTGHPDAPLWMNPEYAVPALPDLERRYSNPLRSGIQYMLQAPPSAFTGIVPEARFQTWMAELERVLTYYLFKDPSQRPVRTPIRVAFREFKGVAYTHNHLGGKQIVLSLPYLRQIGANKATAYKELSGVVIHELTHALQNNGGGKAPGALIEGIADFVRLRSGLAAAGWRKNLTGGPLAGYSTTAYFLDYVDTQYPNFVRDLNALMAQSWSDGFWARLTGKNVQDLWRQYVRANGGR